MEYKVCVISEPYHYYDKSPEVREIMSEIFTNQLRGYKAYYPVGVCPINDFDFFTNHIAIVDPTTNQVLCSYKIIELETCEKYNKEFPLKTLLNNEFPVHEKAVNTWIQSHKSTGYNHGWTINPKLSNEQKKELVDITFAILASFYQERGIKNTIDISIMPFKIHLIKEWMGNKYLDIPPFEVREYGDKLGCIMVNEGLNFSDEFKFVISKYKDLWDSRVEYLPSDFSDEKEETA